MKIISVDASKSYDIIIGRNLLSKAGEQIAKRVSPDKIAFITDDVAGRLYGETLTAQLNANGMDTFVYEFPNGEGSKNLDTLGEILECLAKNNLTRTDMVLALGGGVVGDMAGFSAAVFMRGIEYIQVPTTFLAAIDSSVGGKTAVDLKAGKNLAGSFWQPSLVLCDTTVIENLPEHIFLDGAAECIKYGILADPELFSRVKRKGPKAELEDTIARCVAIKRDIVMGDEYDKGQRQLLNLGHTAAHAIEGLSGLKISHGKAVAIGMVIVSRAAERLGLTDEKCADEIRESVLSAGLPAVCPYSAAELAQGALADKKRAGNYISLVIPKAIGTCELYKIPVEELENFFAAGM